MNRRGEVVALERSGLTARAIAERTGLTLATVQTYLSNARSEGLAEPRQRQTYRRWLALMPPEVRVALGPHAARRGIGVSELAVALLAAVAAGGLVDAVLDDRCGDD